MKIAIVGSRALKMDISEYIPKDVSMIISGGARGIDRMVAKYAKERGISLMEILPDYRRYGRAAPIRRNDKIINMTDFVIAFWDGKSKGTKYVIEKCKKEGKPCHMILCR